MKEIYQILNVAHEYLGTPHKMGGTSRQGIDCSGLVFQAFSSVGISLPRKSKDMAEVGRNVRKEDIQVGDLIFFATGAPKTINHVGIVSRAQAGKPIEFIHASSSKGVMYSEMTNVYWLPRFIRAQRIFDASAPV